MKKPVILAIIPAKGISKRLPGKNLKILAGKPMLAHILETVKGVAEVDRVVVSTESDEVKQVALNYGAEVPFKRPDELCGDDVITQQVLHHALEWLRINEAYVPDYVLLVFPTSPLLQRSRIEEAIQIATERDSDSVISGTLEKSYYWLEREKGWQRLYPIETVNSQWMEPVFKENGAIYLTKASIIPKQYVADTADVLVMDDGENIDVNYPDDFQKVERVLAGNTQW